MPPKPKITRENIISAALDMVRVQGMEALNSRAIAKRLDCSTQPIFSHYSTMDELKRDVIRAASEIYDRHMAQAMKSPEYPPYKASGIAYISFAREERELFRLLFMRDRSRENTEYDGNVDDLIALISESTGLSMEQAQRFHWEMWIFVHGIASMAATSYLDWDTQTISEFLTDAFEGLKQVYAKRKEGEK